MVSKALYAEALEDNAHLQELLNTARERRYQVENELYQADSKARNLESTAASRATEIAVLHTERLGLLAKLNAYEIILNEDAGALGTYDSTEQYVTDRLDDLGDYLEAQELAEREARLAGADANTEWAEDAVDE